MNFDYDQRQTILQRNQLKNTKEIDVIRFFFILWSKIDRNVQFGVPRSIRLLDGDLLIPILAKLMTFHAIWHTFCDIL